MDGVKFIAREVLVNDLGDEWGEGGQKQAIIAEGGAKDLKALRIAIAQAVTGAAQIPGG